MDENVSFEYKGVVMQLFVATAICFPRAPFDIKSNLTQVLGNVTLKVGGGGYSLVQP